ncbi:MAG TPA: CHRD domain-containing protein [Agriterribacter sp.]|nr:CHRD domain-containing protein [Agriterribacter sp.]
MKKKLFAPLLILSLAIFSCQKSNLKPDDSSAKMSELKNDNDESNGGGPYVLNMVIKLSGDNEVPAVITTTKGLAHLRVSTSRKLYSKVIIQDVEIGDALRFSHVHAGATGVNGPVKIFLCHTPEDFGKNIVTDLTDEQYDLLINGAAYVNAHSNFYPAGIVRGQIR